jgi:hypothetical protein
VVNPQCFALARAALDDVRNSLVSMSLIFRTGGMLLAMITVHAWPRSSWFPPAVVRAPQTRSN